MTSPTVFISYSHDSEAHKDRVLDLSERLRKDGIETRLDRYVQGSPAEGWPRWMLDRLDEADFVLVVCTEAYYRRFRGHEGPAKAGKGGDWEGALITQQLYDAKSKSTKFVPVIFSADQEPFIPEPVRGHSSYNLQSEKGQQALYDRLVGRAGIEPGKVGEVRPRRGGLRKKPGRGRETKRRWLRQGLALAAVALVGWLVLSVIGPCGDAGSLGSVVTWSENRPDSAVRVQLDNRDAVQTELGFVRFEDVVPGRHVLGYSGQGLGSVRVGPFRVRGGEETLIPFPTLSTGAEQPQNEPRIEAPKEVTGLRTWIRIPAGSHFELGVVGDSESQRERVAAQVTISKPDGSAENWSDVSLRSGRKRLVLEEGAYFVRAVLAFRSAAVVTVEARVVRSDGTQHGSRSAVRIVGDSSELKTLTFLLKTL